MKKSNYARVWEAIEEAPEEVQGLTGPSIGLTGSSARIAQRRRPSLFHGARRDYISRNFLLWVNNHTSIGGLFSLECAFQALRKHCPSAALGAAVLQIGLEPALAGILCHVQHHLVTKNGGIVDSLGT